MIITYGWYYDEWWTWPTYTIHDCTAEEIATVLQYTLAPIQREYPSDLDAVAEPGIVSSHLHCSFCVLLAYEPLLDVQMCSNPRFI